MLNTEVMVVMVVVATGDRVSTRPSQRIKEIEEI
jgi:hypothetical protein